MYLPAWRMNQTGVASVASRLHARRKRSLVAIVSIIVSTTFSR
jgi:hypothetical protein